MKRALLILVSVVASSVMLVLALPPADVHVLGFVALVPLLLAVKGRGFAFAFGAGMGVLLLGAFLARAGWFYEPSILDGDPGWTFAGFMLFGIAVGLTTAVVGETKRTDKWTPWLIAAWAVVFEAGLLLYLPAHLGLTQYRQLPAMKIASVAGIWGVSYFVWAVNLLLVFGILEKKKWTLAACGAVLGVYLGASSLIGHPVPGPLTVAAVQTQSVDIDELAAYNAEASASGAEIVVWPELSGIVAAAGGDSSELVELASAEGHAPFVTSFEDSAGPMPYNAAAVFSKLGESDRYMKRKPFGGERNEHAAGTEPASATVGGVTYGLNICFDSCFPSVMLDTAELEGVEVILLPTLDPVAPYGFVQAIHAAFTPFRAAELGIPIVRADTTAYSMIVDARGVIVAEAGSGADEIIVAEVTPESRNTVYRRFGDWFLYLCGGACLAAAVFGRFKSARPTEPDSSSL
ncbi:MAG: hypothetical protein IH945_09245 [Armatimonadetes bacterium]|nr:hypothetical protein [Armatimonadota bacterium]